MAEPYILHMVSPTKHVSPFDVNMALDAGFDHVIPYSSVDASEMRGLVQDAMFSRPPKLARRTAFFIGGKNATLALDMLETAKAAMFPPFLISAFADPAGSFTTAGAMVACVERLLRTKKQKELKGRHVAVFGATGVVGYSAGVICALEGAHVVLVGYDGPERVRRSAEEIKQRFGVDVDHADGSTEALKVKILENAEVALAAGRAGVQILSTAQIEQAPGLLVAADVNAVPPGGVEGVDGKANGSEIGKSGVLGIGPFAIGDIKYKCESRLFRAMIETEKAVAFDFRDAFKVARDLVAGNG
jgi:methylene-tetrahydromethanopterin dehydrogenase